MLEFIVLVSVVLFAGLFVLPQLHMTFARRQNMSRLATETGADFPDTDAPQDFPFSLTDDLNWGKASNCIFWRTPTSYIIVMDVEVGFGKQANPMTIFAARHNPDSGIIWSLPRGMEMRSEEGWVVLMKRRRYLALALLSIQQIKELKQVFETQPL